MINEQPETILSPKTKTFWPYGIIIFLITIVIWNIFFATLAIQNSPIPITKKPYEEAQVYQQVINQEVESQGLGWDFNLVADRSSNGEYQLKMFLTKNSEAIIIDSGELILLRPNNSGHDQKIALPFQAINLAGSSTGLWLYEVKLSALGQQFFKKGTLIIK